MRERTWGSLGCAALIGAAIAFPAGMMLAGRDTVGEPQNASSASGRRPSPGPGARNVYSPDITHDPYFLDQQRKLLEALEAQCRDRHENCAEAEQARRWMDRQER